MIRTLVVLVAAMAALALAQSEPPFCHGLNCPRYQTLSRSAKYEVRRYEQSEWARTIVASINYTEATGVGFQRLFDYISGANVNKTSIPMTTPVTTSVIPGAGPFCVNNFTISFMTPFDMQNNPPRPSADNIFIQTEAVHEVYSANFTGFATDDVVVQEASKLAEALQKDGIRDFQTAPFYVAVYDGPYKLLDRHNEIWFYKTA